ncbi:MULTISPECIES: MFS transporter [Thermomonospora]|uniref:Major facilitator superfamily MFS_1 n=1 Tax=Thermomonospora curvata (strain ATCC 19995 / DSM 43183 / JCM 3096 / KCTC 9072 / NBRC 15933 / NCIMB 10081 / Henssen B9) TaxID=471852 RepID=D1ABZ8_THECD|nr:MULTISPECIES: MFS transporter [Thermomonospora]ACY97264.1 major facilitator superfamily MFS_1 [Thermomonospora curvata DSM 43183]PKK14635.1 MAG: MFS transporter [Thermomonospora sp. CIF 1]
MSNPYLALLKVPGARVFVAAGFVGRMSMSMVGIGIVLLVSAVTGSYGIAGSVSAVFALAFAVASPLVGRLADRHGQRRVLLPLGPANGVAMTLLVACALLDLPTWTLFPAAVLGGVTSPGLGAMVRARWINVLHRNGDGRLHTAFSLESVLDEVIFITGPMLVTLLATGVHPAGGVLAAGALTMGGSLAMAAQRGTEPPPRTAGGGGLAGVLALPGVLLLVLVFLLVGTVFGGVEVSVIAFAEAGGHRGLAGVLLASYALGSCAAGLWYGARPWRSPLHRRFLAGLALLVAGLVPLPPLGAHPALWPVMLVVIFVSGLAISPTLIPGYGLVERLVPARRLTEGLALVGTAIGVGVAVGASVTGRLVDARGPGAALLLPVGAGVVAVAAGLAGRSRLREPRET